MLEEREIVDCEDDGEGGRHPDAGHRFPEPNRGQDALRLHVRDQDVSHEATEAKGGGAEVVRTDATVVDADVSCPNLCKSDARVRLG